jgi:hypothetical protein
MKHLALRAGKRLQIAALCLAATASPAWATLCGSTNYPFPFTDVGGVADAFCLGIMEAFVVGITKGTMPTTFSPNDNVPRVQMTTFLQRSFDQALKRSNRRAALEQWAIPRTSTAMQNINVGSAAHCAADGEHIWVSRGASGQVVQVQASTGRILGSWTGATNSRRIVAAAGKVYVVAAPANQPGALYFLDPTQAPGAMTLAAGNLGNDATGLAFDGSRLWTANLTGSVSIITPQASPPYPVTTVSTGFTSPAAVLYDGSNIWVTDSVANKLFKLNASGAIIQTVNVGQLPWQPTFDGTNIWVPNHTDGSITVVQASTGAVVATITPDPTNLLNFPLGASFDGERVLITNRNANSVSLFKAADLSFIVNVATGPAIFPWVPCSDGINFWIPFGVVPMGVQGGLARF